METYRVEEIPDLVVVEPDVHHDHRGWLMEAYQRRRYGEAAGIDACFVQDNEIASRCGVLRGLHFQHPNPQARLVRAVAGRIYEVAVDVRDGSPTFGQGFGLFLDDEDRRQLFVPGGFAHGFIAVDGRALVVFKCSAYYAPNAQRTLAWDDPDLELGWPVEEPTVSERDAAASTLTELRDKGALPEYEPPSERGAGT